MENKTWVNRRRVLSYAIAGMATNTCSRISTAAQPAPVLIELFTSQGCSSCPPADRLAGVLTTDPNIAVVSLNVDYWDYLGWRDTLAKPEYTKRQMDYAHVRGDNDVYTPQMVINGDAHVVGSNENAVRKAIATSRANSKVQTLKFDLSATSVVASLPSGRIDDGTLWVFSVANAIDVKIERGENSGHLMTYHNVARHVANSGEWKASALSKTVPRTRLPANDYRECVAVLQSGHLGPVLAIGKFKLSGA